MLGELGRVALEDHGHALGVGSAGRHQGAAAVLRLQSAQEGEVPDQAATWLLPVGGVAEQSDPGRPEWMPDRDGPAPEVQSLQRHRAHLVTTVQLADLYTIQHDTNIPTAACSPSFSLQNCSLSSAARLDRTYATVQ